jgi:uncharacterized protein DUF6285
MQDRPTYSELLEAVQHFLEADVVPVLDGPKKFHARVAANVLAIVRRELAGEDAQLHAEWNRLNELLHTAERAPDNRDELRHGLRQRTVELCDRIRAGEADSGPWRNAVLGHARQTVVDKLAVTNPKYLGAEQTDLVS